MLKMMFRLLKIYVYFKLFIWMLNKETGVGSEARHGEAHGSSKESEGKGSSGKPAGSAGKSRGAGKTADIPDTGADLGTA